MTDEALLELSAGDGRVMVTFNIADFPDLARRWAEERRSHAGLAIIVGIDHSEFGTILRTLEHALSTRPDQTDWLNSTIFVSRSGR